MVEVSQTSSFSLDVIIENFLQIVRLHIRGFLFTSLVCLELKMVMKFTEIDILTVTSSIFMRKCCEMQIFYWWSKGAGCRPIGCYVI